jgi:hypothetical protein
VIGASLGHASRRGRPPLPYFRVVSGFAAVAAGAIALINLTWAAHWIYDPFPALFLKLWYLTLDKSNLAPLRLFSFIVLALAALHFIKPESRFLESRWIWPVVMCGQNSLYVFCLGIVLSLFGHFLLAELNAGILMQAAVNLAGVTLMIATAALLQWFKTASRRPLAATQTAPLE